MNPTLETRATLEDLLERVLDRGLIIDADIIIHLAGIPLVGIKLRAAIAGIETMLRYGIWQDQDEALRADARKQYPVSSPVPCLTRERGKTRAPRGGR